jgi:hypothetical protein
LGGACAFRGFARTRHRERAAFCLRCGPARFFGRIRERLRRRLSAWRHIHGVVRLRARFVFDAFFRSAFSLLALALDFAPHQLGTAYVM